MWAVTFPQFYFQNISRVFPHHWEHFHTMELDKTMEIGFSNLFLFYFILFYFISFFIKFRKFAYYGRRPIFSGPTEAKLLKMAGLFLPSLLKYEMISWAHACISTQLPWMDQTSPNFLSLRFCSCSDCLCTGSLRSMLLARLQRSSCPSCKSQRCLCCCHSLPWTPLCIL